MPLQVERRERLLQLIRAVDTHGNTAVHMAVLHDRKDAFDLLTTLIQTGITAQTDEEYHRMKSLFNKCDTDGDEHLDSDELVEVLQQIYVKQWEPAAGSTMLRQMTSTDYTAINELIVERATQVAQSVVLLCAELQEPPVPVDTYRISYYDFERWWFGLHTKQHCLRQRNARGLTVLGEAALHQPKMFSHVLSHLENMLWRFGSKQCSSLELAEIDTVNRFTISEPALCVRGSCGDPSTVACRSILQLILVNKVEELAVEESIAQLLGHKWENFGRSHLIHSIALTC